MPEPPYRPAVHRALAGAMLGWCLFASLLARSADSTLTATWRTGDIAIDGSTAEWQHLERVGSGPAVAAQNDDRALFLAIATNDDMVRQQLATGLVVWIDATGRKAQTFGLRLEGLYQRPLPGSSGDVDAKTLLDRNLDLNVLDQFDLLGPSKNQRRLIDNPTELGFAMASGVEAGMMVYELKVPLEKTSATPQAVGAKPGATIALGLETPTDPRMPRQRDRLENPMSTYPRVFDPYGGFFNPPPPPSDGSKPPKEVVIKPMKLIWTAVQLAAGW